MCVMCHKISTKIWILHSKFAAHSCINRTSTSKYKNADHWISFVQSNRLKGEDNTVMRDYVLPDFSSIKKGFCKVSVIVTLDSFVEHLGFAFSSLKLFQCSWPFSFSLERRWISQANTKPASRFCDLTTKGLLSQRCYFTRPTLAFRRRAYPRL